MMLSYANVLSPIYRNPTESGCRQQVEFTCKSKYSLLLLWKQVLSLKASSGLVLPIDILACFWDPQKLQTLTVKCICVLAFMNNKCAGYDSPFISFIFFFYILFCSDGGGRCYLPFPSQAEMLDQKDIFFLLSIKLLSDIFAHSRNLIRVC